MVTLHFGAALEHVCKVGELYRRVPGELGDAIFGEGSPHLCGQGDHLLGWFDHGASPVFPVGDPPDETPHGVPFFTRLYGVGPDPEQSAALADRCPVFRIELSEGGRR